MGCFVCLSLAGAHWGGAPCSLILFFATLTQSSPHPLPSKIVGYIYRTLGFFILHRWALFWARGKKKNSLHTLVPKKNPPWLRQGGFFWFPLASLARPRSTLISGWVLHPLLFRTIPHSQLYYIHYRYHR